MTTHLASRVAPLTRPGHPDLLRFTAPAAQWPRHGRLRNSGPVAVSREDLSEALAQGTELVLGEGTLPDHPGGGRSSPADPAVPAELLRAVLLDPDPDRRVDPRGVALRGALITGELDLAWATLHHPLTFRSCRFIGPVTLTDAHLRRLSFAGSSLDGVDDDGYSLVASGLVVDDDLFLTGWAGTGFFAAGALLLAGARITGQFNMRGATLNGERLTQDGVSLFADSLQVGRGLMMSTRGDLRFAAGGTLRLTAARITGQVDLTGAELHGNEQRDQPALHADGMYVDGDVALDYDGRYPFTSLGAVRLLGAQITGQLSLRGAELFARDICLDADQVRADGGLFLEPQAPPRSSAATGTVRLSGARLGHLHVSPSADLLPRMGEVVGWQLGDVHGVIRTNVSAAEQWLDTQATSQPLQELADRYDRNGQPADARRLRYRAAVRSTARGPWWAKPQRWAYRVTTGHGYYPLLAAVWLLAIFAAAWGLAAAANGSYTTPTTEVIAADLRERVAAQRQLLVRGEALPADEPKLPDRLPSRVPATWCTPDWDVPCLSPPLHAATVALPAAAAAGMQPWTAQSGVAFALVVLRGLAWVFAALLLAGVTGLLKKQT